MADDEEREIDALLAAGQPRAAADRAEQAVADHPGEEGLWARWIIALARSGRASEALRLFPRLNDQFDGKPSAWVISLKRAIAMGDKAVLDVNATAELLPSVPSARAHLRSDRPLPQGVITFFMTDIVGSTRLWEAVPRTMQRMMARHDELMVNAVETHDGIVVRERGEGDSVFSVFQRATDAAAAALTAQLYLTEEPWPPDCVISVRSALHTGEAGDRDGDYDGPAPIRAARLRGIAEAGQILVSQATAAVIIDHLPDDCLLVSLGTQKLKDMERSERVYLLVASEPDMIATQASEFAKPESASRWEVVVGADRHYYEGNELKGGGVPSWDYRHPVALAPGSTSIGRPSKSAGLVPDIDVLAISGDSSVSRAHAVLEWSEDGSLTVVDLDSTNGTFVNDIDHQMTPHEPLALADGDRVYLGAWTCLEVRRIDG